MLSKPVGMKPKGEDTKERNMSEPKTLEDLADNVMGDHIAEAKEDSHE